MAKWLLLMIVFCASCSLFGPKFSRTNFSFTANNKSYSFPIIVPKGYRTAKHANDSTGTGVLYDYGRSAFYVVYVRDTTVKTEFVDPSVNIPLPHPLGGFIYKGLNENGFWREIRRGHLRVGYKDVPRAWEGAFDSATNHAARIPIN